MKKSTKSKPRRESRKKRSKRPATPSPRDAVTPFNVQLRELLVEELRGAVARTAEQLVEDEVRELVGEPWSRKGESTLRRGGGCRTRIFLDGEPVHLERTRVRDQATGTEHRLRTVGALSSRDALDEGVRRLLVQGVSTCNYDPALGRIADGLGLKKSAISSAFQRASQKDLDAAYGAAHQPDGRPHESTAATLTLTELDRASQRWAAMCRVGRWSTPNSGCTWVGRGSFRRHQSVTGRSRAGARGAGRRPTQPRRPPGPWRGGHECHSQRRERGRAPGVRGDG